MLDPLRIVMCYVPCGSLHSLLRKARSNPECYSDNIRNKIILDICEGLCYLHEQEPPLIHRDLRSPNVFIQSLNPEDVVAKIADFGMSQELVPQASGMLLTWQWMAPEAIDSHVQNYDEKIDIYSLAMVILETFSKAQPFDEIFDRKEPSFVKVTTSADGKPHFQIKVMQIKAAICKENFRPALPSNMPTHIVNIITQCWSHNPRSRPSAKTAQELFRKALGRTLSHHSAHSSKLKQPHQPHSCFEPDALRLTELNLPEKHKCWSVCALVDHVWVGATATVSSEEGSNKVCGNICIFSAISFQQICTVEVHDSRIYAILPVGNMMWCTSADGKIYVISCASFLVSHKISPYDNVSCLIKCLISVSRTNGETEVWSCAPGEQSSSISIISTSSFDILGKIVVEQPINSSAQVSKSRVYLGCFGCIINVSVRTREVKKQIPLPRKGKVTAVLAHGHYLWASCDTHIFGVDIKSDTIVHTIIHSHQVLCLNYLSGRLIVGDSNGYLALFSHKTKERVALLEGKAKEKIKGIVISKSTVWAVLETSNKVLVWK